MKKKHTNGPWFYDGEFIRAVTKDDGEVTIATVRGWSAEHRDEEYENGLLIAKAPVMFSTLNSLRRALALKYGDESQGLLDQIDAVLSATRTEGV